MSIQDVLNGERQWHVECGDCRKLFKQLPYNSVDLIFADPPFNRDVNYAEWDDGMPRADYEQFTRRWLISCFWSLKTAGSLWVNIPDDWAGFIEQFVTREIGLPRANWRFWHYRFGQNGRTKFTVSHTHLLHFALKGHTWNPDAVLVESDRASVYGDKRTKDSATPGMRVPFDVWGVRGDGPNFGRVHGKSKERRPLHPNQLSEKLLERVILSTSNPGDLVADPFTGSATTGVVAVALGRRFIGFEISEEYAASARERIAGGAVRVKQQ